MPLRQLAHGPTAETPADVLARLPRSTGGETVPMGSFSISEATAPNAAADDAEETHLLIEIDEFIGWWTTSKRQFKRTVKQARPDRITLRIASLGGFVDDALAIHDFLKDYAAEHEVEVTVLVNALTASSATIIACTASPGRLFMSETALFLVHEPWGLAVGNRFQLARSVKDFERFSRALNRIYQRRTGLDAATIETHLSAADGDGEWWDAEETLALGYVDVVYAPGEEVDASASAASASVANRGPRSNGEGNSPKGAPVTALATALGLPPLPAAAAERLGLSESTEPAPNEEAAPEVVDDEPEALAALQESLGGLTTLFTETANAAVSTDAA
ncbi:MAG: Clp protease ClpP [Bacteroidota bacterium]